MKESKHKGWATFLIALGIFLIAVSPLSHAKYLNMLSGVAVLLFGLMRLKR